MTTECKCPRCQHTWDPSENPYLTGPELVREAKALAEKTHEGQTRKFGNDKGLSYFGTHLSRSVQTVSYLHPEDYEAIAVTWLHDSIEDHPDKIDVDLLMRLRFPPRVINGILSITKESGDTYLEYLKKVFCNPLGRIAKWADLNDNADGGPVKYRLALELFRIWHESSKMLEEMQDVPAAVSFLGAKGSPPPVGDYLNLTRKNKHGYSD